MIAGCAGQPSVLLPASPEATGIAHLWWVFLGVCVVVYAAVMAGVLVAWFRRRAADLATGSPIAPDAAAERETHRVIAGATVLTTLIVLGLFVADLWLQRRHGPREDDPLVIRVTGHQWWWALEYQNPDPSQVFESANEIHVPVGRSILLLLESNDVIHSFWVPRLHGKKDLIPGHPASLTFKVDQAGRFEGVCAEFCGYQHAHMGILVIAQEPADYETWANTQRAVAHEPASDTARRGKEVLETTTCAMCHTVHGALASSRIGPALTHFGSRQTLAAGAAPNEREQLRQWILDPQKLKPGAQMPANPLSPTDLNALLDYLATLQ